MKMYLISDNNDTRIGLRLVGVDGITVHTEEELKIALNEILKDDQIGILLINEKLALQFPDIINDIKLNRGLPLVVEIAGRHGSDKPQDFITSYVKEAIGVKLK